MRKLLLLLCVLSFVTGGVKADRAELTTDGLSFAILKDRIQNSTADEIEIVGEPGTLIMTDSIVIRKNLVLKGNGLLTLKGDEAGLYRMFIVDSYYTVELNDITFENGKSTGGGVIGNFGTLNISGCTFKNNTTTAETGTIKNMGTLNVINSIFKDNEGDHTAAIYSNGALNIINSTFTGNKSQKNNIPQGGTISNRGSLTMINCILTGNTAQSHPAWRDIYNEVPGTANIAYSLFETTQTDLSISYGKNLVYGQLPEDVFEDVENNTLKAGSKAARVGTLASLKDGQWYFLHGNNETDKNAWGYMNGSGIVTEPGNYTYSPTGPDYGLTGGNVLQGASRTASHPSYILGTVASAGEIVDKSVLEALLASIPGSYTEENYTPESWGVLEGKILQGEAIVANNNAMQIQVNNIIQEIRDAIGALVPVSQPVPPIDHTIRLTVGPGVSANYRGGNLTVMEGERFSLEFRLDTTGYTNDDLLLLVNGEVTPYRNLGEGYPCVYTINPVEADCTIEVALRVYTVYFPVDVKGGGFSLQGDITVNYGDPLEFYFWLGEPYYLSDGIYANGVKLEEAPFRSSMYNFYIEAVKGHINLEARGIKEEQVGNTLPDEQLKVYTADGTVFIDNAPTGTPVLVYGLTGKPVAQRTADGSQIAIPLSKGIYIVKTADKVLKAVVRD